MRTVQRSDVLDYQTYEESRETLRARILEIKQPRRVHVGPHLTFLFENWETIRYQIQEMMRAERIVREAAILHEIETYNELLGGEGELGCTLLVEVADPAERDVRLREWRTLPEHVYARLEDGAVVRAKFDPRQMGDDRLSSVQYLKLHTGGQVPVAIGVDHPRMKAEAGLPNVTRAALAADLRG
jgi:hypothetical protein